MSEGAPQHAAGSIDAVDGPHGVIWTLASMTDKFREARVAELRSRLADGAITRDEIVQILRIEHAQMEYYHAHYWGIVVKAVIAVIAMIALPYVIRVDTGGVTMITAVFPGVAVLLSGFCTVALKSEEARLNNYELKIAALEETLDPNYRDFDPAEFTHVRIFKKLNKYHTANLVLFLFMVLALIAAAELWLILTRQFVF